MNVTKILLLPALIDRAKDAARAVKQGIHTIIYPVMEATLSILLDLPQFKVTGYSVEKTSKDNILHLFCELTTDVAICPSCQTLSTTIKNYKQRCVRDCSVWGKRTFLHFKSRRFECPNCDLRFTEELASIGWRRRQTYRFEEEVYRSCQKTTLKETATQFHLSQSTVRGIFKKWGKQHCSQLSCKQIRVLGLDEISLKKRHKQYALVISDIERHCVLDVLSSRDQATLTAWFERLPLEERRAIRVVSIDMWRPYRTVVEQMLPSCTEIVADRFHVMKQLNNQLTKARRQIQQQADPETAQALKGCRWLLVRNRSDLTAEQEAQLQAVLAADPQLRQAYLLKEEFRTIFERIHDRHQAERFLRAWALKVQQTGNRYLLAFVKTLHNWWDEILNYFNERVTNGFVEGMNRAIRAIIWRAYGYRNFDNFRLLILAKYAIP